MPRKRQQTNNYFLNVLSINAMCMNSVCWTSVVSLRRQSLQWRSQSSDLLEFKFLCCVSVAPETQMSGCWWYFWTGTGVYFSSHVVPVAPTHHLTSCVRVQCAYPHTPVRLVLRKFKSKVTLKASWITRSAKATVTDFQKLELHLETGSYLEDI